MQTIIKQGIWKILKIFYSNRNKPVHLREIARLSGMNESTASLHLKNLVKDGILKYASEGNLKKFYVSKSSIPEIFPLFDQERLENLPLLRKNAIKLYIKRLENKPVILIVFGSTAKGSFREDSDLDLFGVFSTKRDTRAEKLVEAQTGVHIQAFRLSEKDFLNEIITKKDKVLQSAINSGFPVFNQKYFYEAVFNE
ncbi:nucleotidyltransferase domain-containing protein [Candidatus Woesearchaeota archaeon]|nr:nucleotidyltransferase domain-containing protein [Candidatus Woesearchaeota archaeon]